MNTKFIKLLSLLVAMLMTISVMTSCGKSEDEKTEDSAAQTENVKDSDEVSETKEETEPASAENVPAESEEVAKKEEAPKAEETAPAQSQEVASSEPVGKYAGMETYKKDGVEYGKTEDGKEVAISGENMQKLIEQYEKVKDSDPKKEQELLDQLQVILDNAQQLQEN